MSAESELRDILARLNRLKDSEHCAVCKEDLTLASRGIEASAIKLGRMNQIVRELESKDLMRVDEELAKRYASPAPREQQASSARSDLGVDDVLVDAADMLMDVKELTNIGSILPQPPSLPGLPGPSRASPTRQIAKRPPLLHELLLGTSE